MSMQREDSISSLNSFSPPGPKDQSFSDFPTSSRTDAKPKSRFLHVKTFTAEQALTSLLKYADMSTKLLEPEAADCLVIALQVMSRMSTSVFKTEHILFSLLVNLQQSDVLVDFLSSKNLTLDDFTTNLKGRELFMNGTHLKASSFSLEVAGAYEEFKITYGVAKILKKLSLILKQIDGKADCLTLFSAIILEGTSVAADVITQVGKSAVSPKVIGVALKLKLNSLRLAPDGQLDSFQIKTLNSDKPNNLTPFTPDAATDFDITKIQQKDGLLNDETNWVIYPNLLIGGNPGFYFDEVEDLLEMRDDVSGQSIARTTFVCLMGEYTDIDEYYEKSYPRLIEQRLKKELNEITFIHYPIHDFAGTKIQNLTKLVTEIKKRILNGERVLLHCRGGHGRTGMVVIPLVAALYKLSFDDAAKWVRESYAVSARGKSWNWRLPETREQEEVSKAVIAFVHKNKRA